MKFSISTFYIFVHYRSSLDILPNFKLLLELAKFEALVEKMISDFLENSARVEIILTINVENCTNI